MHLGPISKQKFGMAKVSEKAYEIVNRRYGKQYADNFTRTMKEIGGDNMLIEDIYGNDKTSLPCAVKFPAKYNQGTYIVNLELAEPIKRNISLVQDAFFKDVRNQSALKGGLLDNFEELKKDFPDRKIYIAALFNKTRPEMRNQEEIAAIKERMKK